MAELIHNKDKIKVKDGTNIREACRKLGVPFSCEQGYCGLCSINILEGEDNLEDLTPEEENLGMDKKRRLACECKIKSGKVKISF